jgi:hypothetical protein
VSEVSEGTGAREGRAARPHDAQGARFLANAAVWILSAAAGFTFAGYTYYERLFREFGLKPSVIELSSIDIAARGVDAIVFAPFGFVDDHWRSIVLPWLPAAALGMALGLAFKWLLPHRRPPAWLARLVKRFDRLQAKTMRWLIALFLVCLGYGAGYNAGAYDAAAVQRARGAAINCCTINGDTLRGIPLGQDDDTIVIVMATKMIVRAFTAIDVASCTPRQRS